MNTVPAPAPISNSLLEFYSEPRIINGLVHVGRSYDPQLGMWWPILESTPEMIAESKRLTDLSNAQPHTSAADLDERCDEVHKQNQYYRNFGY